MRSSALLLAIGLFVADTALASPCKPKHSTSRAITTTSISSTTSIASTTQSTSSASETSTSVPFSTPIDSSSTSSSSSSVASITQSTSSASETSTSVPFSTPIDSSSTSSSSSVSVITSTTTTPTPVVTPSSTSSSVSSTTAPAALPTPTFTIVGGGGDINGAPLKGIDQDGTLLIFNPNFGGTRARTFVLDPNTGRLSDKDTGVPVCAYYGYSPSPSVPAMIAFCQNGNTGPNSLYDYLTCQIAGGKLTCTAPRSYCFTDDDFEDTCVTPPADDVINQFYYQYRSSGGDYFFISRDSPNGYTPVDILAQES